MVLKARQGWMFLGQQKKRASGSSMIKAMVPEKSVTSLDASDAVHGASRYLAWSALSGMYTSAAYAAVCGWPLMSRTIT